MRGLLAEHWDVIQGETSRETSKSGLPMFGNSFQNNFLVPLANIGRRLNRRTLTNVFMTSLLKLATDAHGGVDRWNQLKTLKAHLSVTGAIWHVKGKPDVLRDIRIELSLHEQRLITHLVGQNRRFVFTPHQVSVEDEQGNLIEKRDDPRHAFEGQSIGTPWDDLHVAYFDSYALWTYLSVSLYLSGICDRGASTLARRRRGMATAQSRFP
jgi:hypothetical protein